MLKKPTIICAGILNTKGEEIRFLAENVAAHGGNAKIMDLSLGGEVDWADISLGDVLATTGVSKDEVFQASRLEAAHIVGKAGAQKIKQLHEQKGIEGIISWAGATGTTVATRAMRALPLGVPKIMMSTVAASDVSRWLVHKDIYIMNPIAEQGINKITRMMVNTAAASIVSMAQAQRISIQNDKQLVAITAYGTTYQTVKKCADFINRRGYDSIAIHQTGSGAAMEDLIRSGQIAALYDITTAEISNTRFHSPYGIKEGWEGERLTAAAEKGIPQIVCPGGLDQFTLGPFETVPKEFLNDYRKGMRVSHNNSKLPYIHSPEVTTLNPSIEETQEIARYMIDKLNNTKGPTLLCIPMKGWSSYDQPKELASFERGWPKERGNGPVWWPDTDNPSWSLRATSMWAVMERHMNTKNQYLDLIICDMHLLDESFAELLNRCMGDMLDGIWKKGLYRNFKGVIA